MDSRNGGLLCSLAFCPGVRSPAERSHTGGNKVTALEEKMLKLQLWLTRKCVSTMGVWWFVVQHRAMRSLPQCCSPLTLFRLDRPACPSWGWHNTSPCASISNPNPDFTNGAQPQPSKTLIQSGVLLLLLLLLDYASMAGNKHANRHKYQWMEADHQNHVQSYINAMLTFFLFDFTAKRVVIKNLIEEWKWNLSHGFAVLENCFMCS